MRYSSGSSIVAYISATSSASRVKCSSFPRSAARAAILLSSSRRASNICQDLKPCRAPSSPSDDLPISGGPVAMNVPTPCRTFMIPMAAMYPIPVLRLGPLDFQLLRKLALRWNLLARLESALFDHGADVVDHLHGQVGLECRRGLGLRGLQSCTPVEPEYCTSGRLALPGTFAQVCDHDRGS